MERIAFIVERLNMPPFDKGIATMTEFDSITSIDLLEVLLLLLLLLLYITYCYYVLLCQFIPIY